MGLPFGAGSGRFGGEAGGQKGFLMTNRGLTMKGTFDTRGNFRVRETERERERDLPRATEVHVGGGPIAAGA